jgi:hypothetical protein
MIPKLKDFKDSQYTVQHVIRDIFLLGSLPSMTQIRHFWAGITNFISKDRHFDTLTATHTGAEKMGHSYSTHLSTYSSHLVDGIEEYFNLFHSAIGDISHALQPSHELLSLADICFTMKSCHPSSDSKIAYYSSLAQKDLVEFGRGHRGLKNHCLCLLAPGQGKSMSYFIPTIARCVALKKPKMILHISPYTFLAGFQHHSARNMIHSFKFDLKETIIETCTAKDINDGKIPDALKAPKFLPALLFLNLDAAFNLFTNYKYLMDSWVQQRLLDRMTE